MSEPVAKRPRRTQEDRREEAKGRIIEAAVRLVAEKGFDRVTLTEVGEAAGYSRGLPAHYFGNKNELLYEIAQQVVRGFRSRFETAYRGEPGLEMLIRHVESYFELSKQDRNGTRVLHRVLAEAQSNPELQELMAGLNRRSTSGFRAEIEAGIAKGEIRPDIDPEGVSTLILASLRGISSLLFIDRSIDRSALRKSLVSMLRTTLEVRRT